MGKLTTHVLDLVHGCPGRNIQIELFQINDERKFIRNGITNSDGRVDDPLMEGDSMSPGTYELMFRAGEYFRSMGLDQSEYAFVDEVVIRFGIENADEHYHVPLLLSRFGYSTYRGS